MRQTFGERYSESNDVRLDEGTHSVGCCFPKHYGHPTVSSRRVPKNVDLLKATLRILDGYNP